MPPQVPHLYRTILPADDLAAADRFWSHVLELQVDVVVPTRHYLHTGGAILALVDPREHGRKHRPNPDITYLRVPDAERAWARAQEVGARPSPKDGEPGVHERVWGDLSCYLRDPAGNPVCLIDDARSRPSLHPDAAVPSLDVVILPVWDLRDADRFWGSLLGVEVDTEVDNRHFIHPRGASLCLVNPADHERFHQGEVQGPFEPNPELVYFSVDDLEAAYARAGELGMRPLDQDDVGTDIQQRPWGERSFYGADPFENPFCFVDSETLFLGRGGA
jgi:catechol 2,3-dioxygenase-like lactoylglutathione lyase family enzyme